MTDHAKSADERKTKKQLVCELKSLHRKVTDTDLLLAELIRNYKEAPVGLCVIDLNLRFLHINDWLAAINGMPVEEHLGRTISEVLPHVAAGVESQLRQVIDTGEPIIGGTVDAETPAHPGLIRSFQHSYSPIRSDDGTVIGVGCVVQEVTGRKRAEDAIKRLNEGLEQRVRERTREIGVHMAVGAQDWHILGQVVLEAMLVVAMGGLLGFAFSASVIFLIQALPLPDWMGAPQLSLTVSLVTVDILSLVGLMAGLFPARRAAAMDPVLALEF